MTDFTGPSALCIRVGRRTRCTVDSHRPFRQPATAAHEVGELLDIFTKAPRGRGQAATRPDAPGHRH